MIQDIPPCSNAGLPHLCSIADRASSSLDVAHELIRRGGLPEWGSVLVREQTAGRGQLRRTWVSPRGNVYAALRLPHRGSFATLAAAPALGLMLADALCSLGFPVKSKWPNDILQESGHGPGQRSWRKVGGILLEERAGALIAGIGFNLVSFPDTGSMRQRHAFPAGQMLPDWRLTPERRQEARALASDIERFWTCLAGALFSCYSFTDSGAGENSENAWLQLVPQHLAFVGFPVCLQDIQPGMNVQGILEGINSDGSLRLWIASPEGGGVKNFLSGSLSLC